MYGKVAVLIGSESDREIMEEAGFKETRVYWEGTTEDGDGDGEFKAVTKGEDCEAWVSYVVGLK